MYKGKLVFATNNDNKLKEVVELLPSEISIVKLSEIGCVEELPETHGTLEENAIEKATYVCNKYEVNCFAEDTGLEVEALNNAPGVYSARYAGTEKDPQANIQLLLENMEGLENRSARFRTVIALLINNERFLFEGTVNGMILKEASGTKGFGYDPVFCPDGYKLSFAQMDSSEKNKISHRGKAIRKLVEFLQKN